MTLRNTVKISPNVYLKQIKKIYKNTMLRSEFISNLSDNEKKPQNQILRPPFAFKRVQSSGVVQSRWREKDPLQAKNNLKGRRCQSLSPTHDQKRRDGAECVQRASAPENLLSTNVSVYDCQQPGKDATAQRMQKKAMRGFATKKREFLFLRKNLMAQQDSLLEQYAALKELEIRAGVVDEGLGDMRIVSLKGWPAHDLLLLVRDDLKMPMNSEISGAFGQHVIGQIQAQLNCIPDEMLEMGTELLKRRLNLLEMLRCRLRSERGTYTTSIGWKSKNQELDEESEQLHRMVTGMAENLKAKIISSLELAKLSWKDRDTLTKKVDRLEKENAKLQFKIDETLKKEDDDCNDVINNDLKRKLEDPSKYQGIVEELTKERAAKESLKAVVASAESMLRVARSKIAALERQLKETRSELETARRKHKDLEHLYHHRESHYNAHSKKLLEVSKTGEITIDTLSRQRDALELRVKELREQAEATERVFETRTAALKSREQSLLAKVANQEKNQKASEERITQLEDHIKKLEEQLASLRERSFRLADLERHCLDHVPSKEKEPTEKETEVWKELQVARLNLSRAEEEIRHIRADKDRFLNSLSKIAQDDGVNKDSKLAAELLNREKQINQLQQIIEEHRNSDKIMEQNMSAYESQLAALRLEVRRLRNYDCYAKEISNQDLQTELLEMSMQVEILTRERKALVNAAASRALMLERHERAADLFTRITRTRRELVAELEGRTEPPKVDSSMYAEISRSLSSVRASATDAWSALKAERARVLSLESAVLSQCLQLEREELVRTQLEHRRAQLERELLRTRRSSSHTGGFDSSSLMF